MKQAIWLDAINNHKIINYKRLKGGVSSEVYEVRTKLNSFCLKRSLKKLLVKKNWIVNQNRIYYEYLWLNHCRKILKKNIPKTFEYNNDQKYILMEYFDASKFKTLKELYFKANINLNTIKSISKHLYKIHSQSKNYKTKNIFKKNNNNFFKLRLDPYFNEVAKVYPKFKKKIKNINKEYLLNASTLVHGDFSPKNILIGNKKIIYLDAECCNYGDPVFDLVFFSNHLLIKSIYFKKQKKEFLKAFKLFYGQYFKNISIREYRKYLLRIINMTPIMLLARIDGKSPVEYISSEKIKNKIRKKSFKIINTKINDIDDMIQIINE